MAQLTSLQICFSGTPSPLTIPSATDQQQGEADMMQLTWGLQFLDPSPECEERIRPFLCLHIFGLCDSNSTHHTTLRQECTELRDDVCAMEWSTAVNFLPVGTLPVCESLPDLTDMCTNGWSIVVCVCQSVCHSAPAFRNSCSPCFLPDRVFTEIEISWLAFLGRITVTCHWQTHCFKLLSYCAIPGVVKSCGHDMHM